MTTLNEEKKLQLADYITQHFPKKSDYPQPKFYSILYQIAQKTPHPTMRKLALKSLETVQKDHNHPKEKVRDQINSINQELTPKATIGFGESKRIANYPTTLILQQPYRIRPFESR